MIKQMAFIPAGTNCCLYEGAANLIIDFLLEFILIMHMYHKGQMKPSSV